MQTDTIPVRPIWFDKDWNTVKIIDQRMLPHDVVITDLKTVDHVITAITDMYVRGAPLIGVTGAFGVYLAAVGAASENEFIEQCLKLKSARPTAINLSWAVDRVMSKIRMAVDKPAAALAEAQAIAEEEADNCRKIGQHGVELIRKIRDKKEGGLVNILTHCNAGWLACIEYGTATAPMYAAYDQGIDIHVWVDETRPLNQGARLTAWELGRYGIRHTVITDNAGGHLMQHGMVDIVIVGTDRTTCTGDVANKIGTYLKALAANDNHIPFYVALPSSTFDWSIRDGITGIPIEERDPDEVRYVQGIKERDKGAKGQRRKGEMIRVLIPPEESPAANYAFDITPARLVTGFITERGVCNATETDIRRLFPETC